MQHDDGSEWDKATARSGEPWTPAEERHLQQLFARPRRVKWFGRWRTRAMYYAAKTLRRTPCACSQRMHLIQKFSRPKQ